MKDTQRLVGAKTRFGNDIATYDDGYGPLWIHRDSMGISGIVRAKTWEDAYEICEDEFFPEADETVEEIEAEHATIYLSGRELWEYEKGQLMEKWKWEDLSEAGRDAVWRRHGKDVPFLGHWSEHPCFQEAYGFRPNGPNARDKHKHGIYAKDLNGDSLDLLTPEMIAELGIRLDIASEWEVLVGNVGSVYVGDDEAEARRKFDVYVESSKSGVGRAGDEPVTLMCDGEPVIEHFPATKVTE